MDRKEFLELSAELAKPINFDELVASGALIQKGKSYYIGNIELLPKYVSRKIKSTEQNRNGVKVTFYK
ncbi:TPA: hypothetical protein NGR42_004646 [Vibrio parahaemolyticus]|uniref:hypothetical protein n=1 Tax=Vibrio TaxID=662 RepID=UPI0004F6816A|nr:MULTISPECIES: hypothetical protein [Vibrio]EHA1127760.1 hypothetical protein [Vibrio navarrensis]AIL70743.1 hypothetical protein VV93_v1c16550 [Vibrio vulnificus]EGR1226513.1 hypothetical protein [Vibrio parahaemolyticus]EGR7955099.1 hypothetical protein [Vibrio vulnificus]EJF7266512.1 hypothetical protein [Vibrio parahaemolyticus]